MCPGVFTNRSHGYGPESLTQSSSQSDHSYEVDNQIGHLVPDMIDETGFNVDELWDADTSEYQ